MDVADYISHLIQVQYGITKNDADKRADNIIANYASCAGVQLATVKERSRTNIRYCFENTKCYGKAHGEYPSDVDGFERALILCMCDCAKNMPTEQ